MTQTPPVGSTFFGMDLSVLADRFSMFRRRVSKRFLLLEFGGSSLTVAQARFGLDEVEFTHVRRVELPPGATERGVPTESAKMAGLIQQICKEEKIFAHRTAVVLPAKAAFNTIIRLPQGLSLEEARTYARNPSSGLQIPIPLQQTDFDVVPCSGQPNDDVAAGLQPYFLSSVPQKLVDQLLDTLQRADLELLSVDLPFCCQLRLMAADVAALGPGEFLLLLDCVRECSHLVVVANSGPMALFRLSAIREFPTPVFDLLKTEAAVQEALSAEAITLADEGYMALSDLDLRVLVSEIQGARQQFSSQVSTACWKGVAITGVNSAHPGLADLLKEALDLDAHVLRPLAAKGVGAVSFSSLLVHQSLGRLIGLGLGLLPHDALLSCPHSRQVNQSSLSATESASSEPSSTPQGRETPSAGEAVALALETMDAMPGWSIERVKAEPSEAEPAAEAEEERVEELEEEWPSLGLGGEGDTAEFAVEVAIGEGVKAVDDGVKDGEPELSGLGVLRWSDDEESPSIERVKAEPSEAEPSAEAKEERVEELEEEWPSLRLVGEEHVKHYKSNKQSKPRSHSHTALLAMSIKELKQCCRDLNLSGYSSLRKDDLIKLITTRLESPD